ncbi:unnamed protein product [Sphagnum balticum]
MEFEIDEFGNRSVTFIPPGRDGKVPEKFRLMAALYNETPQLLRLKGFVASLHTRYGLEAGGAILEHMVPEPRNRAHDIHPNVLFIEYVAWVCVTSASPSPYSMWLQPPQILTRRLIPSSILDVVLGALLTAADINDKFHPIKVEKAHVSGNFYLPIRESSFRDTHMSRGHSMVDLVNVMGSEWQDVSWLAPPVAILTGENWRRFARDNCVDDGDVCVLEMERGHPYISHTLSSPRKLQIKVHVFRMGFP